ncbi:divergent polysaccharide deacetylase family protein [Gayadomonas joobiniege]|uniref:divergent polysaccharide deacetylase family protein n=1 Tax=Gayadomonas joobiniege TaxID=1234606 RepID=UPI00036B482A|nr:divergent polysaccharide deacetylase family protein [Gayadomonas joobiniege]
MFRILLVFVWSFINLLPAAAQAAGTLSIIIDDVGYRATDTRLLRLPHQITLALLPATPYAKEIAQLAKKQSRAVMLHLPMQSKSGYKPEPNTLTLQMTPLQLQQNVRKALADIPDSIGINNHMGSLLTENSLAMLAVMQVLKEKQLLFVDSKTSHKSVAYQIAKDIGVEAYQRHVFLDNLKQIDKIRLQLDKAIQQAKTGKQVIAIGHPYPQTLTVLNHYLTHPDKLQGVVLRSMAELKQPLVSRNTILEQASK